jgi:hypothetical protein
MQENEDVREVLAELAATMTGEPAEGQMAAPAEVEVAAAGVESTPVVEPARAVEPTDDAAAAPIAELTSAEEPAPAATLEPAPAVEPAAAALPAAAPLPAIEPRPANRPGSVYRGLPRPVRIVGWIVLAIAVGVVLGLTAPIGLRRLGAVIALSPGMLAWYSARALGFLAYGTIAVSVLYGLLLSTKILDSVAHRPVSFTLHKELAIMGLVLAGLHAGVLLADESFAFTPRAILVPFASPYAPQWVGIGQVMIYLIAIVTLSFYVRRHISQRAWRLIHYLTFGTFVGVTVHGIMAGSDSGSPWAFWAYLVPSTAAVFLLVYRIVVSVAGHLRPEPAGAAPRPGPLDRPGTGRSF